MEESVTSVEANEINSALKHVLPAVSFIQSDHVKDRIRTQNANLIRICLKAWRGSGLNPKKGLRRIRANPARAERKRIMLNRYTKIIRARKAGDTKRVRAGRKGRNIDSGVRN